MQTKMTHRFSGNPGPTIPVAPERPYLSRALLRILNCGLQYYPQFSNALSPMFTHFLLLFLSVLLYALFLYTTSASEGVVQPLLIVPMSDPNVPVAKLGPLSKYSYTNYVHPIYSHFLFIAHGSFGSTIECSSTQCSTPVHQNGQLCVPCEARIYKALSEKKHHHNK